MMMWSSRCQSWQAAEDALVFISFVNVLDRATDSAKDGSSVAAST
jgi:hypothetical protein